MTVWSQFEPLRSLLSLANSKIYFNNFMIFSNKSPIFFLDQLCIYRQNVPNWRCLWLPNVSTFTWNSMESETEFVSGQISLYFIYYFTNFVIIFSAFIKFYLSYIDYILINLKKGFKILVVRSILLLISISKYNCLTYNRITDSVPKLFKNYSIAFYIHLQQVWIN